METKKEIWIDKTLNSTKGIKSVAISESLKKRLVSIPLEIEIFDKKIPLKAVWLAAASLALLLTVNIATVRQVKKSKTQPESSIYTDYFSYLDQL